MLQPKVPRTYMFEPQSHPDSDEKSVVPQNRRLADVSEWQV